ncbi:MAG TPA: GNAT family N-acetyltransferase [Candidatus Limnocylindrales bacterium]|nr:GNAT family N-acetyltransferase [Candidatus Limnocylindrales bacterium]
MELRQFASVETFLAVAEEFLVAREAEHNLILGVCNTLLTQPGVYTQPPYLAVVLEGSRVVAVSTQTPPWDVVLSEMDDPTAVDAIVEDRIGEPPPGVIGPAALAERFAAGWSRRTGSPSRRVMRERAFRLSAVTSPKPTTGAMRAAGPPDHDLVERWLGEFMTEALGESHDDLGELAERWVNAASRTPDRAMQLWIDDGVPVSMTGFGARTPNGQRVGPVYTPSDLRARGYASNLVAKGSQAALDAGRRFLFLFTDLANPTSNKIYRAIGYEPVTDIDRYTFG